MIRFDPSDQANVAVHGSDEAAVALQRRKLVKAAQDFEGILVSEMWKSMLQDAGSFSDQGSAGALMDVSMQAMCSSLAASGGLGIGRMLMKALEPSLPALATGNSQR